jgi:3-hydroxyisobutyrate dehydrogenase-like beta-hydroxyacid dehydrogenase
MIVGLLHPGQMGSAVGNALVAAGHTVLWASEGRSDATRERAAAFADAGTLAEVAARSDVVVSVVPPHAAVDVARSIAPFSGLYVDANAIAPETARTIGSGFARFVDAGIVGGPPAPRVYVSGAEAQLASELFAGSSIEAIVVADGSALKTAYAAWTKVTAALVLAIDEYARRTGVTDALQAEWEHSLPDLPAALERARRTKETKGWRFTGELEQAALAFADEDLPPGFHEAAAAVYRD